jgi:hypothetical protein
MDMRDLTRLVLKLAGLYMLVNVLVAIPSVIATPKPYGVEWGVSLGLYAIAGLALLLIPGRIINRVLHISGEVTEGSVSTEKLLRVGSILLGVYFIVAAAYGLIYTYAKVSLFFRVVEPYSRFRGPEMSPDDFAYLLASGVQIALGLFLWLGSRFVVRFARWSGDDR